MLGKPIDFQYLFLRFSIKFIRYFKYSINNPKWFCMFILCRFQVINHGITIFGERPSLQKYRKEYSHSLFKSLNVENAVTTLKTDGYCLGINLRKSIVKEVLEFASHDNCFGNGDPQLSFPLAEKDNWQAKYGKKFIIGEYLDDVSKRCSAIAKLKHDPKLLEIAATYLNSKPICTGIRLWWSFPVNATLQERMSFAQELFHYDPLDYRCLKFFFYLTDVDLDSGPHVCVRGSHKKKKLSHKLSLFIGRSDQDIIDYYKLENIVTLCGEAGFGFAEDPFCFHKGNPPRHKNRLMLQIEFCLNDYRVWEAK